LKPVVIPVGAGLPAKRPDLLKVNLTPVATRYAYYMAHKQKDCCPMSPFLSLFIPVFLFLMLLTIGFSLRERNIGVLMMWIGTLGIFGLTCWKILEKLPS
jgi:hypothetical protein